MHRCFVALAHVAWAVPYGQSERASQPTLVQSNEERQYSQKAIDITSFEGRPRIFCPTEAFAALLVALFPTSAFNPFPLNTQIAANCRICKNLRPALQYTGTSTRSTMSGFKQAAGEGFPSQPEYAPESVGWVVRYCYEGGNLRRSGRFIFDITHGDLVRPCVADDVLAALRTEGVDLDHFEPRVYDSDGGGWVPLSSVKSFREDDAADGFSLRVDLVLFRRTLSIEKALDSEAGIIESQSSLPGGFFTIGVVYPKYAENVGTLWRSAYQSGAASLFVVGPRKQLSFLADTTSAWQHIPFIQHMDWNSFAIAQPYDAQWVAVEMGGEPLETFEHPVRACYILGSEDNGLPKSVIQACHRVVSLPAVRTESFNVAVAGSIVMYDRIAKERRRANYT